VHCGRLSPEKKPQRSLNTLATLRANGLSARLVVAGDGPLRRRLERRAARDRLPVTFAGFLPDRSDLAALLASADVAIAPGPAETFGLAGLEALACGTPVVGAESALPEVVGEAGASVAGEDLAAGVTTVLSWPEPTRRAAARARAEHFGWPAAVRAFLAIHEALVADEAGGGDRLAADVASQGDRLAADVASQGDRLAADEAGGRGQVADGVAAGAGAGTGVRTERRPT
jgi:alpha-1,6-mannosyltransferase